MAKKGRPTLSKKLKKVNFGFTASPQLDSKLKKIRGAKSPFIGAVLASIPQDFISRYNSDPDQFLSDALGSTIAFEPIKNNLAIRKHPSITK